MTPDEKEDWGHAQDVMEREIESRIAEDLEDRAWWREWYRQKGICGACGRSSCICAAGHPAECDCGGGK